MELVQWIRAESQTPEFKSEVEFQRLDEDRSYRNLATYEGALFKKYSRLLVVRVDLAYLSKHRDIGVETARADLRHFLNNRRNNALFNALVGYIWKLEYAELRGHHYHVMLFFDGSKVLKDSHIGDRIGQYWEQITKGRGTFYNCNRRKHRYVRCGIGMVSHGDRDMRDNLLVAIRYLTKAEQLLRFRRDKRVRAIGRGVMPGESSGLGRPRVARRHEEGAASESE